MKRPHPPHTVVHHHNVSVKGKETQRDPITKEPTMRKHASSHGLAMLVCTITSGWLVRMSYDHYPAIIGKVEQIARHVANAFSLGYSPRDLSTLFVAVLLAMIWGIFFAVMHRD